MIRKELILTERGIRGQQDTLILAEGLEIVLGQERVKLHLVDGRDNGTLRKEPCNQFDGEVWDADAFDFAWDFVYQRIIMIDGV